MIVKNIILCLNIVIVLALQISCSVDQNKVDLNMIHVPGGSLIMGDSSGNWDEVPLHKVNITQPFFISETEVTTVIYKQFNKDYQFTDEKYAVGVSWHEATEFCKWLSEKEGKQYRLPTEAEWEYALIKSSGKPPRTTFAMPCSIPTGSVWGVYG